MSDPVLGKTVNNQAFFMHLLVTLIKIGFENLVIVEHILFLYCVLSSKQPIKFITVAAWTLQSSY